MTRQRDPEFKPLYFSTTLRNPLRIRGFLEIIAPFNGQVLTTDLTLAIESQLIRKGFYKPTKVAAEIKALWRNGIELSDEQVKKVIDDNPQSHKEANFPRGWPSRFHTHFGLIRTFGFIWYQIDEEIELSQLGELYLAKEGLDGIPFKISDETAFLTVFAKYQRRNPFVRVKNDNKPLILLLETIKHLEAASEGNPPGIAVHEIPFFNIWRNSDSKSLASYILNFRREHGLNPSSEVIFENCEQILGGWHAIPQMSTITKEQPDDILRKLRLTGLFSLRGQGRYLSLNSEKTSLIEYMLVNYSRSETFETEREYWDYVSVVDKNLVALVNQETEKPLDAVRVDAQLQAWADHFGPDVISRELSQLGKRRASSDPILRLIPEPVRLEFLVSMFLKTAYQSALVVGNYRRDDEGIPTSPAPGGKVDIEVYSAYKPQRLAHLYEVTLIKGRSQVTVEMVPISRHYSEYSEKYIDLEMFFIAPTIHPDTIRYSEFIKHSEGMKISSLSFDAFLLSVDQLMLLCPNCEQKLTWLHPDQSWMCKACGTICPICLGVGRDSFLPRDSLGTWTGQPGPGLDRVDLYCTQCYFREMRNLER